MPTMSSLRRYLSPLLVIWLPFARERLTAFTLWHLDAVSGSYPLTSTQIGHQWSRLGNHREHALD
jgi:hypothetical protein